MIAFIADPDTLPVLPTEQIRGLYGLTAAEAEVALAVLDGEGVGAIADGLGISVATARTHLHRIFEKTVPNGKRGSCALFLIAAL